MPRHILIVDDDEDLSYIIEDLLETYGYSVVRSKDTESAFSVLAKQTFHLILLDINLPDSTGFEFCQELRKVSTVPIIFASARISEADRITGFDIGGDDYLPKPYSMKELLSRVNALMRRTYGYQGKEEIIAFGDILVNITSRMVQKAGRVLSLSLKEFDLLAYLCQNKKIGRASCRERV